MLSMLSSEHATCETILCRETKNRRNHMAKMFRGTCPSGDGSRNLYAIQTVCVSIDQNIVQSRNLRLNTNSKYFGIAKEQDTLVVNVLLDGYDTYDILDSSWLIRKIENTTATNIDIV